ncbi:iron hydrogenase small subunit [Candidatus Woesearchaeota archaeon]|nr:iron hydrogenase small subunit [Candidatus Woesearchaeota archaeon]
MTMIKINGTGYETKAGETILETCLRNNIDVPYLCYHPDMQKQTRCRICIVEVNGKIQTSCNTLATDGMDILTDTEEIKKLRRMNMELMLAGKDFSSYKGTRFAEVAESVGVTTSRFGKNSNKKIDEDSPALIRDNNKCILCGRCVQKCQNVQTVNAIGFTNRGHATEVTPYFNRSLNDVACVQCGQCSLVCPTGAIKEQDNITGVMQAIADPEKIVLVQTAPSIRAAIGETQGMEPGSLVTKKMVSALRKLGFDRVLDTDFSADLTIVEEGTELISRIRNNGVLPMMTSCCPGWIKFMEHFYPDFMPNVSTCKSPQQMFGALVKTYYAEKNNMDPSKIVSVSVMPCTAKKFEIRRPEMRDSGYADVDHVLTTRELGDMVKSRGIDFQGLDEQDFDPLMGQSTGAAAIFGATGGVMEAALRTAADILEGKELESIEYQAVRGMDGIKEAEVEIAGMKLKVAVAHGLGNARKLFEHIRKNPAEYHFIEIMCCPGGCSGGGGQPIPTTNEIIKKRNEALYREDQGLPFRKSHKNPEIIRLYDEYIGSANSEKAHHLLHTGYSKKNQF